MANPDEVNNLKEQIGVYLRDGIIDAREEFRIMVTGKEAGLDLMEIIGIVTQVENDLGLGHQNSALLHLKSRAQQFLDNDGVIDTNEMFFLQEIARERGITADQLHRIICDLNFKKNVEKKHKVFQSLLVSAFAAGQHVWKYRLTKWGALIVISLLGFWISKPSVVISSPGSEKDVMNSLNSLHVKELSLHRFRFHVITDVMQNDEGNPILRFTTGGLLGQDVENSVLMAGGVDVRYGITVDLNEETCKVDDETISLSLPAPKVIDKPTLLAEGDSALRKIGERGKDTGKVEDFARASIQKDAENWPEKFGLDGMTRQRAKDVLTVFIKSAFPGKKVVVRIVDEEKASRENTNPNGKQVQE